MCATRSQRVCTLSGTLSSSTLSTGTLKVTLSTGTLSTHSAVAHSAAHSGTHSSGTQGHTQGHTRQLTQCTLSNTLRGTLRGIVSTHSVHTRQHTCTCSLLATGVQWAGLLADPSPALRTVLGEGSSAVWNTIPAVNKGAFQETPVLDTLPLVVYILVAFENNGEASFTSGHTTFTFRMVPN